MSARTSYRETRGRFDLEIGRTQWEGTTRRRLGRVRFPRWLLEVAVRVTLGRASHPEAPVGYRGLIR